MKKAMKLVWMVLFALPMISLTACGDDDDLVDDNTGSTVELKDYSDLIGKKYNEVTDKLGSNYDLEETNQYQIVYYDYDVNVTEIGVYFTFYEEVSEDVYKRYETAVMVNVDVKGFSNAYLIDRLQKLYGEGTPHEDEDGLYFTYEKSGKYIIYVYDAENQEGEITYVDKKEFDKVNVRTKGADLSLRQFVNQVKAVKAAKAAK